MANKSISRVLLVLVLAQFIITIDTTFMNVSISMLVKDLSTTVTGIQSAIALYALVMAAFMIAGAKFGDIIGRRKAFIVGLITYSIGTTIASLSSSLPVFMFGWSLLEGTGAALMLPAMMSLIADNFKAGPDRAKAYAAFAATAGIAAAIGPIVGGLFTTYLSWRLAFASELLVAIFILTQRRVLKEQFLKGPSIHFDWPGFALSATGLVLVVQGIILASSYGFLIARVPYTIGSYTLLETGSIAPTPIFVVIGLIVLGIFFWLETRRLKQQKSVLLNVQLLRGRIVRAGSINQMMQALTLTGVIFALSLYVQMQLNYSAIQSGLTLLPLSIGVLGMSSLSSKVLANRYSPKGIMVSGFFLVLLGTLIMGLMARDATAGIDFAVGLLAIGSGVGFILSQNQNLIISSVKSKQTNETSGVINTSQNIGSSLGTSIAGAIILAVFISIATGLVDSSATFNSSQKNQLNSAITSKAQIVSDSQLTQATVALPEDQQQEILSINQQARERSLTVVYFAIGTVGALGIISAIRLPKTPPLAKV